MHGETGEVDAGILHFGEMEKEGTERKVLLGLLIFAFLLRLPLVFFPEVIYNDGTEYVRHAHSVLTGNWSGGKAPPLYPALVALAHLVVPDPERAGILISIIFGSLLILPVFYLGREMFSNRVGILSSVFAAVHSFLYLSAGSVLTESTYHLLFATSVLFGWHSFAKARFSRILLFSLFATLAYLTRPEAIGLPIVFSVWVLSMNPPNGERRLAQRVAIVFIAGISFFVFSFPYLYQIRKDTGTWGLSKKTTISIGSLSGEEAAPSLETLRTQNGMTLSSLVKHPLSVLGKVGTGILSCLYKFQQSFNPILFFLAVIGWLLLFKRQNVYPWKGNLYLLAHLIFYFGLVFPFFFITKRHTSQMISISIPWAAFGFLESTEWLHRRWGKAVTVKKFFIFFLVFLLAVLFIQGRMIHSREIRVIRKEAGLWMRDHLPRGANIMSRLPQEAFYAGLPWTTIPEENYETILRVARSRAVKFLVVDEDIDKYSPDFWKNLKGEDLILLKDLKRGRQRMAVFEVVYPQGNRRDHGEK